LRAALTAGRSVPRVARAELGVGLRMLALELGVRPALEITIAALAQRSVVDDVELQRRGDRRCGRPRAPGVAAMHGGHALAREPLGEQQRLRLAVPGQPAVCVVALDATLAVPLGLAVADQEEPDLSHAAPPASAREGGTIPRPRSARRCRREPP